MHNTYRCEKTPDLGKNPPIECKKNNPHISVKKRAGRKRNNSV